MAYNGEPTQEGLAMSPDKDDDVSKSESRSEGTATGRGKEYGTSETAPPAGELITPETDQPEDLEKREVGGEKKYQKPDVKPRDWIRVGSVPTKDAVVSRVYSQSYPRRMEVVYLDDRDRAIYEDVVWGEELWEFRHSGPVGGYADRHSRLSEFVAILHRGRYS